MSDIVERLRDAWGDCHCGTAPLLEAADEIERLDELLWQEAGNRVEIERLRAEIERLKKLYMKDCTRLDSEVALLRAALQTMLDCHGKPHREDWTNDAAYQYAVEVDAKARRAMEPKP